MQRLLYAVSFPLLGNYNKTFAKTLYLARKLRYILCDQKKDQFDFAFIQQAVC